MGQRKRVWINKAVNERRRNSVTVHSIATKPHALRWRLNSASSASSFARSRRAAHSSIIRHSSSLCARPHALDLAGDASDFLLIRLRPGQHAIEDSLTCSLVMMRR